MENEKRLLQLEFFNTTVEASNFSKASDTRYNIVHLLLKNC